MPVLRGLGSAFLASGVGAAMARCHSIVAALGRARNAWKLIRAAGGGVCAQPESPGAFASAIETLCRKPKMAQQCDTNGRFHDELCCGRLAYTSAFGRLGEAVAGGAVGQR